MLIKIYMNYVCMLLINPLYDIDFNRIKIQFACSAHTAVLINTVRNVLVKMNYNLVDLVTLVSS